MSWIIQNIKDSIFKQDEMIYEQSNEVHEIYFMKKGLAGFVFHLSHNVVYL